eukprot:CAMPEP_0202706886 /NCGR_PEP_ID=MMETSP1385-20130828/19247_1 /ASSEMBLY_ACC=CAM_ASM_000861 /TAXON_ID=933848 /ORGANISM="Elphidium margaritaceum" /LENGTH=421 /DNA_ID=CAMNT_0049365451 /DNA_START=71 /DNA_END=1336 /DNA_ORIENTATION=+
MNYDLCNTESENMNVNDLDRLKLKSKSTASSVPITGNSQWSWFSVWGSHKPTTPFQPDSGDFEEIVAEDVASRSRTASYDNFMLEKNLLINDQYVDVPGHSRQGSHPHCKIDVTKHAHAPVPQTQTQLESEPIQHTTDNEASDVTDVDEQSDIEHVNNDAMQTQKASDTASDKQVQLPQNEATDPDQNDAVMISQTLTLRSRNEELQKERNALQSETMQLRMQTQCLEQAKQHIIAAQKQEIVNLREENSKLIVSLADKDEELQKAQQEIEQLRREKGNLATKVDNLCQERLQTAPGMEYSTDMTAEHEVLVNRKQNAIIYGCKQCGQHLFDSSAMIQQQIEIDDHCVGCLVECLFNAGDVTMGPLQNKIILNGMFKVKEIFCDGCLATFGWKIIESFDEWNAFQTNKYCIDIAKIKTVTK